jgi:hypothetical protein
VLIDNWRTILNNAYSVRFSLASAVSTLVLAWQAKSIEAIIPAVLAVLAIVSRVIPQPSMKQTEEMLNRLK